MPLVLPVSKALHFPFNPTGQKKKQGKFYYCNWQKGTGFVLLALNDVGMGYEVTAQYRQAEARYGVDSTPNCSIATLLHYAGPQYNRPPRRFVVLYTMAPEKSLTTDVCQCLQQAKTQQTLPDPLFPDTKQRTTLVDNLV